MRTHLTIEEALAAVLETAKPLPSRLVSLDEALGCQLAESVASDLDSPPYDKSIVDGYALSANALPAGTGEFTLLEEVVAGAVPRQALRPGTTTRIMTGAPIPAGTEGVVMIEHATQLEPRGSVERIELTDPRYQPGQNILRRGSAMRAGDEVLRPGALIRPAELALLAEVGRGEVQVIPRPSVAVLSTGNELVPIQSVPGPGQIRNSNETMLVACARSSGAIARGLGICRDEPAALREAIRQGLASDVLIVSGGVSAGVLDLAPAAFLELGVEPIFHKVRVKPGKPVWFGVWQRNERRTLVFGLPGNPVSSLVGFALFVQPALGRLAGLNEPRKEHRARLSSDLRQRGDRVSYVPIEARWAAGGWQATPVRWNGSADVRGLVAADGWLVVPAGEQLYRAGSELPWHPWRGWISP